MDDNKSELVYACTLSRILNYDCTKALELAEEFTDLEQIFQLSRNELAERLGKDSVHVDRILDEGLLRESEEEIKWAEEHGIRILYYRDPDYPQRLRNCCDAPLILYYRGNADLNTSRVISIVGTRKATPYGLDQCRKILEEFSYLEEQPLIVSGLAYGIDICAHRKAVECGLKTLAVIPTGMDQIYPAAHRNDAIQIIQHGGLLTELQRRSIPHRINFIRRNRIIAGLCDACILIESDIKGGGMITAQMAESYDRELFALPGRLCDPYSQGCNSLIRENKAGIIYSPKTIIHSMGWRDYLKTERIEDKNIILDTDCALKQKILVLLSAYKWMDIDSIIRSCHSDLQEILLTITELEIEGRITRDLIGRYSIA